MNIDRIAREMVDVEPSVDLEARIRARVKEARPNRAPAWWSWRVAVPLTAAAAIALALIVQGPGSRVQSAGTRAGAQAAGAPSVVSSPAPQFPSSPAPQFPSSPVPQFPSSQVARVPTSKVSRTASQLSAEELAWMDRRIPALDSMNSLQVDHLRVDSIQPEPLAITPLTMTPVATEGGGIERRNDR